MLINSLLSWLKFVNREKIPENREKIPENREKIPENREKIPRFLDKSESIKVKLIL